MMRAMYSAVAGLRTHLGKMDTIGNNLANVNTPGYKKGQVTFKDLMSQTQRGASAAKPGGLGGLNPQQIGMGVGTSSINVIHTRMGGTRTDNPTDVMIEGEGFFVISPKESGGEKYYTRAGNFNLDNQGNLVSPEGFHVLGHPTKMEDGQLVIDYGVITGMKINQSETAAPTVTERIQLRGNIDSRYVKDEVCTADTNIYDTLGNAYNVKFQFKRLDNAGNNQKWQMSVIRMTNIATGEFVENKTNNQYSPIGGVTFAGAATGAEVDLEFDEFGKLVKIGTQDVTLKGGTLSHPVLDLKIEKGNTALTKLEIGGKLGNETTGLISLFGKVNDDDSDYRSITQYANDITLKPYARSGSTSGNLTGFSIGTDGVITGSFSNGDTKILGQLLLAKFDNPMGLEKVANNMFRESRNSGEAQLGVGNASGFGAIASGTLEMSNVDMAQEFTDIITTQRGFQANSRVITTSDEMLQELVNIKR